MGPFPELLDEFEFASRACFDLSVLRQELLPEFRELCEWIHCPVVLAVFLETPSTDFRAVTRIPYCFRAVSYSLAFLSCHSVGASFIQSSGSTPNPSATRLM
jgi:hypothetical protein